MKALVLLLAGCGRFGFDGVGDGAIGGGDTGSGSASEPMIVAVAGNQLDDLIDIAFDGSGGFAVTGNYSQTLTLGALSATTTASLGFDLYAAGFDASGTPQWLWSGNASVAGSGQNIARLPDGRWYLVGYFGGVLANGGAIDAGSGQDALQLFLSPNGAFLSALHAGGQGSSNIQTRGLGTAGASLAFGGIYTSTVDFGTGALPATGAGIDNAFVVSGDVTNGVTRARAFNGGNDVYVNDVAIDAAGRVCIAGRFNTTTDFGGGAISSGGGSSGFVARYDADFTFAWAREIDTANMQSVALAANGDCIAGGFANGSFTIDTFAATNAGANDGFAIRFAAGDGHAEWLQPVAGTGDDKVFSVATYDQDRVVIAGFYAGTAMVAGMPEVSDGASDGFVIGLAGDGTVQWTQLLAGSGSIPDTLSGIDIDLARRKLALAADFDGELRVGTATQTAAAQTGLALILPLPP